MSKEQITPKITESVMQQIREQKITMRPRIYFIAGSVFVFFGLVVSIIASTFLITVTSFVLRTQGFMMPMRKFHLQQVLANFPWWVPILAIGALALGIWLLRQYEFSYKKNFLLIIILFIAAVIIAGVLIDATGLNMLPIFRGPMRMMMIQHAMKYPAISNTMGM